LTVAPSHTLALLLQAVADRAHKPLVLLLDLRDCDHSSAAADLDKSLHAYRIPAVIIHVVRANPKSKNLNDRNALKYLVPSELSQLERQLFKQKITLMADLSVLPHAAYLSGYFSLTGNESVIRSRIIDCVQECDLFDRNILRMACALQLYGSVILPVSLIARAARDCGRIFTGMLSLANVHTVVSNLALNLLLRAKSQQYGEGLVPPATNRHLTAQLILQAIAKAEGQPPDLAIRNAVLMFLSVAAQEPPHAMMNPVVRSMFVSNSSVHNRFSKLIIDVERAMGAEGASSFLQEVAKKTDLPHVAALHARYLCHRRGRYDDAVEIMTTLLDERSNQKDIVLWVIKGHAIRMRVKHDMDIFRSKMRAGTVDDIEAALENACHFSESAIDCFRKGRSETNLHSHIGEVQCRVKLMEFTLAVMCANDPAQLERYLLDDATPEIIQDSRRECSELLSYVEEALHREDLLDLDKKETKKMAVDASVSLLRMTGSFHETVKKRLSLQDLESCADDDVKFASVGFVLLQDRSFSLLSDAEVVGLCRMFANKPSQLLVSSSFMHCLLSMIELHQSSRLERREFDTERRKYNLALALKIAEQWVLFHPTDRKAWMFVAMLSFVHDVQHGGRFGRTRQALEHCNLLCAPARARQDGVGLGVSRDQFYVGNLADLAAVVTADSFLAHATPHTFEAWATIAPQMLREFRARRDLQEHRATSKTVILGQESGGFRVHCHRIPQSYHAHDGAQLQIYVCFRLNGISARVSIDPSSQQVWDDPLISPRSNCGEQKCVSALPLTLML